MTEDELKQHLSQCCEVELYLTIHHLGGVIWSIQRALDRKALPREEGLAELKSLNALQKHSVSQCTRFGVENPAGESGTGSEDYWRWYTWWDDWRRRLKPEELKSIAEVLGRREHSDARPQGEWKDQELFYKEE